MILGQSHIQGSEEVTKKVVKQDSRIREKLNNFPMNGTLFHTLIELSPLRNQNFTPGQAMVDCGCSSYGIIDSTYTTKCNLKWLQTHPICISTFEEDSRQGTISEVAYGVMRIKGHMQPHVFFFVAKLNKWDMILGCPWIHQQDVHFNHTKDEMLIHRSGTTVANLEQEVPGKLRLNCVMINTAAFKLACKNKEAWVFAASMRDIEKALRTKTQSDPKEKLPEYYHQWLDVFDCAAVERLPPHQVNQDHAIELELKTDGTTPEVPWGSLYTMSKDELLVLHHTLNELLDKGFICMSQSSTAAPVLFMRKPGGGLQFCMDYHGLNRITRKDCYLLPLIQETLNSVGKAKYFTKLDVITVFHKIRVVEGDEWKTTFQTCYSLYEWLVTPFGLANTSSTFQKYINHTLRGFLDDFCSAYIDDILIYTDGTLGKHKAQVKKILQQLQEAGLQIDIDKCEFHMQSTKYLGFILEVGKGLRMDPEKISTLQAWEAPTSVRAVQAFLGFANFYQ